MSRFIVTVIAVMICTVLTAKPGYSENNLSKLRKINREITQLVDGQRPAQNRKLKDKILYRKQLLKALIQTNPAAIEGVALSRRVSSRIPVMLRKAIETTGASIEGTHMVEIVEDFSRASQQKEFIVLKSDPDRRIRLHFPPRMNRPGGGSSVTIGGTLIDSDLVVTSFKIHDEDDFGSTTMVSRSALPAEGETAVSNSSQRIRKIAMIFVLRSSDVQEPYSIQLARNAVFGATDSVRRYFEDVSYGKMTFRGHLNPEAGDVFGWYTVPTGANDCNYYAWANAAKALAAADGFNVNNYDHIMFMFPYTNCLFGAAQAELGGKSMWVNGAVPASVLIHELGHNLGLSHAKSYRCFDSSGRRVSISPNCIEEDYGDTYDVMGGAVGHFSAFNKLVAQGEMLNLLNIRDVTASGTYNLAPLESFTAGVQNLRILRESEDGVPKSYYYIEFRKVYGPIINGVVTEDPNAKGVVIRIAPPATHGWFTHLIDATPETATFADAALPLGRSFFDAEHGVQITTQSISPNGATVAVNFGAGVCIPTAPSITINPRSHHVRVGDPVTYSATISNNNVAACGTRVYRMSPSLPVGWTQTPTSETVTLSPGQTVTRNFTIRSPLNASLGTYEFAQTIADQQTPQLIATASASVTATNAPISLNIVTPSDGATVSGMVAVTATTDIPMGFVNFRMNGGRAGSSSQYPGPYTGSWDSRTVPNGPQTIEVVAVDTMRYYSRSSSITVNVNNPLPTVNIVAPTNGSVLSGSVTLTATIPTTSGASVVEFLDGESPLSNKLLPSSPNTFTLDWHTPSYGRDGLHTLTALVYDQWGRVNRSAPVTVTLRNHTSDRTPPVAEIVSPATGSSVSGIINLRAVANDSQNFISALHFFVDETQGLNGPTQPPYVMRWDTRSVTDGPHTIRVRAYDAAGNVQNSSAITVIVNNGVDGLCAVDFDGTGYSDSFDLFAFLNTWVSDEPRADFDRNGSISLQDIFAFLSAWLVGC